MEFRKMVIITLYAKQIETQMYGTDFWTLWEKVRVGCFDRTALKQVYHQGWNRSPAQVGCMRQVLGPGALGRPRGIGWRGRWERGSRWGIHVTPWLIHVNVWQDPLQYCKVISLQLIKVNGKKNKKLYNIFFTTRRKISLHKSFWNIFFLPKSKNPSKEKNGTVIEEETKPPFSTSTWSRILN